MSNKRILTTLLLIAQLCALASCGDDGDNGNITASSTDTDNAVQTTADPYDYPELDCNGDNFTILNTEDNQWDMYTYLDFESQTGEIIDDAVYERNRALEERYNFKMEVLTENLDQLRGKIETTVAAGEDIYDVTYCRGQHLAAMISNGYLLNLYDIPEIRLNEEWWNQPLVESATLNGNALYFAHNYFSLCSFDNVWSIFFNESMMEDLGQDMPYDLVREGKWTIDKFKELARMGTNLNGDASFTWNASGNAIYGCASFNRMAIAMFMGADTHFVDMKSDKPTLTIESDRFYTLAEKLSDFFKNKGDYIEANSAELSYIDIFCDSRSLFLCGGLMIATPLREMEDSFGILPLPKFDEEQENYLAWMNYDINTMCIPVTNSDPTRTGILLDALSYLSYRDILPKYYSIRVSQKSLRNEDSIEMLDLIRESLCYDPGQTYGWTRQMATKLRNQVVGGNSEVASVIAAEKPAALQSIEDTYKMLAELE